MPDDQQILVNPSLKRYAYDGSNEKQLLLDHIAQDLTH